MKYDISINDDLEKICMKHNITLRELLNIVKTIMTESQRLQILASEEEIKIYEKYYDRFNTKSEFFIFAALYVVENDLLIRDDRLLSNLKKRNGRNDKIPIYFSDTNEMNIIYNYLALNNIKKSIFMRYAAQIYIKTLEE